ncbi:MAG: UDP-N-acetylglucosamine--N-acetylmuramyl-(pentapeptide) pyrophosphoryl-undecaprenol N-acetylglucosamine transferase [Pelagibacteraceae bacterium]|nr:UDP-N-acetylglucosamine--N-acetylmuramyl-(pentapeptide) pyrophosphoryl-undecaprenol N-acetylglucosamine transferase [Pelagibacteraceae bacterium]PHX89196.1 MAG: UDP-N-acetylglucosamine--N-acetylmuramyl-(pentapeptide) pyrophosphoryl-undecaprenol N-acetylglucosamine transferase [Pelagibacteraceae bacterium]
MKKKILISTGGSGGHVIPASVLLDHLNNSYDVLISSDQRGIKYFDKKIKNIIIIDTPRLNNFFLLPFYIVKFIFLSLKSFFLLKKENIKILISTGGYMSLPICLSAKLLNIKIFLLEPNMILGRANNFCLHFSEKIFCYSKEIPNFPKKYLYKIIVLKPLVRKKYYEKKLIKKKRDKFTIIIVGGSQGAKIFDEVIHEVIAEISPNYPLKVIHQTSEQNLQSLENFYFKHNVECEVFNYNDNLYRFFSEADLSISRAGASTLAELSLLNVPFLAVPLPKAKDNHQLENAIYYKNKNCCWIIEQKDFSKKNFNNFLLNIINNKDLYLEKKINLQNFNYQNTWISVNEKILNTINEY